MPTRGFYSQQIQAPLGAKEWGTVQGERRMRPRNSIHDVGPGAAQGEGEGSSESAVDAGTGNGGTRRIPGPGSVPESMKQTIIRGRPVHAVQVSRFPFLQVPLEEPHHAFFESLTNLRIGNHVG
jgi:CubicO group peptidase (beta-lactamase class C family)